MSVRRTNLPLFCIFLDWLMAAGVTAGDIEGTTGK